MLRKSLMLAVLAGFVGHSGPVLAQGLPPEDGGGFEIDTAAPEEDAGFFDNLSQYVGATAGATNGTSEGVDKTLQALSVTVDVPMPRGFKAAFAVDFGDFENTYKLEQSEFDVRKTQDCQATFGSSMRATQADYNPATEQQQFNDFDYCSEVYNNGVWDPRTKEIVVTDSFTELNEAFVQWEPTSFMTIQAGRQPIVLGQFEAFSPLMFLTPMKSTGTKTRTAKRDMSFAQDGLNVSLFPTSNIELSFLTVGAMRLDPSTEKRLKEFALNDGDGLNIQGGADPSEKIEDIADHDMSVARLMYFGDNITFGVTSIEGADSSMDLIRDAKISTDGSEYFLTDDKGSRFPEMSATAVEFSYRVSSKWTLVFEYTEQETEVEWHELPSEWTTSSSWTDRYQQVIDNLNGQTFANMNITMGSVGMVYKGDRWLANLQLAQRTEEGASALEDTLYNELDYEFLQNSGAREETDDTLPILNVVRLLGAEKQGYTGFGFGVFAQSFGFGATAGWRFFEKLEVGAFAGMALDVTGADELEERGYESPEGESYFNLGVNYLF